MFSVSSLHNGLEGWLAGTQCRSSRARDCNAGWGACIDVAPSSGTWSQAQPGACEFRDSDVLVDENGLHILARGRSTGYASILATAQRASLAGGSSDALSDASTHEPDAADLAAREHFMRSVSASSWRNQDSQTTSARQGGGSGAPRSMTSLSGLGLKRYKSGSSSKSPEMRYGRVVVPGMSKLSLGDGAIPSLSSSSTSARASGSAYIHPTPPSSLALGSRPTAQRKGSAGRKMDLKFAQIRKVRVIGKGSTASVWQCEDESTRAVLAVKQLSLDGDEDRRSMAMRELVTMYGVDHEKIVTCHNVFYSNSSFHLVMELMDGGSLLDALSRGSATSDAGMPPAALAAIAVDVLAALAFLHDDLQVIHRDIKPGNILLSSNGRAKLGDLGIATRPGEVSVDPRGDAAAYGCGCSTPAVEWIGTMKYMSPERLSGDRYSFSADIWSLGIVLLEAALARYPLTELAAATHGTTTTKHGPAIEFWDLHDIVTNGECPSRLLETQGEWADLRLVAAACLAKQDCQRPCARDLLAARSSIAHLGAAAGANRLGSFLDGAEEQVLAAWIQSRLSAADAREDDAWWGMKGLSGEEARDSGASELLWDQDTSSEWVQGLVEQEGSEADGWL